MKDLSFRSPLRKLVMFFRDSRDKWKKKCQDAKHELKLLKRRFANLQKNHQKNHDLRQQQLRQVEAQRRQLQTEVELLSQERATLS